MTKTLHIVDGESCGGTLRVSGLAKGKEILSWREALYAGPVPPDLALRTLSRVRSRFWTNGRSSKEFDRRDAHLKRHKGYANIALWFGPDCVLCQLSLVQLLSWFREQTVSPQRLSWVALHGGELRPDQMAGAYASRRPITSQQMRLAERVWRAFRQSSPRPLAGLLKSDLNAIPRLRPVAKRILQEYPSTRNGLSRLEGLLVREIQNRGMARASVVVAAVLRKETVGDAFLFDILRKLIQAPHPLLRFATPFSGNIKSGRWNGSVLGLTDTGQRVLAGKADAIALNGIDRWIGAVHLQGTRVPWRWNERLQTIVTAS